jgi:hypothetical protein
MTALEIGLIAGLENSGKTAFGPAPAARQYVNE